MKRISKLLSIFMIVFLLFGFIACEDNDSDSDSGSKSKTNEWLILCYFDGDNDLVTNILDDVINMSYGLSKAKNANTKILTLYDGIGPNEATKDETKTALKDDIKNQKVLSEIGETRLIELKAADTDSPDSESYKDSFTEAESNLSFADLTAVDYTSKQNFFQGKEADMSDWKTLKGFLDFAGTTYFDSGTFNTDNVILIISDHGSGASSTNTSASRNVCSDETTKNTTDIGTDYVAKAISESKMKDKLKIIHFDLCLTADLETAYEMKDLTDYIVASPNVSSGSSWSKIIAELTKSTTPKALAQQIVKETAVFKSVNADNETNKVNYAAKEYAKYYYDSSLSPTYSAFDAKKISSVYDALNKVINALYAGVQGEYKSKFLTSVTSNKTVDITEELDKWLSESTANKPHPVDYLFAADYSYAAPKGIHGWAVKSDDTNNPAGRMTSMWYNGTYVDLIDIGYLMKMFIEDSKLSDSKYKDAKASSDVTNGDFVTLCKKVQEALEDAIIESHRCDATKTKPKSASEAANNNFYRELDSSHPRYFGMTMAGGDAECKAKSSNVSTYGVKIASITEAGQMSYRYSCKFVNQTKWIDVLDAIFTEESGYLPANTIGYDADGNDELYKTR